MKDLLDGRGGSSSAVVLGKHYTKQVDVLISHWSTGPELMISTKRMDSSLANNAANRVEESYGDAKNLRLRHPLCALGFFYSLSASEALSNPGKTAWLVDLLQKLGREDDAYDAVGLIIPETGGDDRVALRHDLVPAELSPDRFFQVLVEHVLRNTPVTFHRGVRDKREGVAPPLHDTDGTP